MFVVRNPWPLALAAVMVVSLAIGWIGAVLDERSARRHASAGWGAHSEAKLTARVFEDWISGVAAEAPELAQSAVAHLSESLRNLSPDRAEAEVMIRLALARLLLDQGNREAAHAHAERACELAAVTRGVGKRERERAEELRRRTAR